MTTSMRFAALVILTAATTLLAGASDNEVEIGNIFLRTDSKMTKIATAHVRTLPKAVTAAVRKLEKADAKGKSVEQLVAIANTATTKLQAKGDKAAIKLFAFNDDAVARLTELEAQNDYFIALSFVFSEWSTQVIQGTTDAMDQINTALANEIAD